MDLNSRIDPELAPSLDMMPADGMDFSDLPAARVMSNKMFADMAAMMPPVKGVITNDRKVPGPEGSPDVNVRIYTPENKPSSMPGIAVCPPCPAV